MSIDEGLMLKQAYEQGRADATKWHYPSQGELPPRGEQVLCWLWNGNYILAFIREDNEWTTNGKNAFDGVKCWQYIEPPKEEVTVKCCENCGHYKNNVCEKTKTHPNKPKEWTCLDWKEEV